MAFFTTSSTSARLPHDSASSPSVDFDVSQISRGVNFLKNGSVSSITNASSLTIMHAALSSVNFGLNVKPSAEKNSFDALRLRTARLTNILRDRVSAMTRSLLSIIVCSSAFVGLLEPFDVDLLHLEHRGHDAFRFFGILVLQHLRQDRRNDLPRHAEAILEPAALHFLAARGQLLPEMVHFLLRLAVHHQRDRLGELEERPAIERHEPLAIQFELDGHDRALRSSRGLRRRFVVTGDVSDLGVSKDRRIEPGRLFALAVEPQTHTDLLHGSLPRVRSLHR